MIGVSESYNAGREGGGRRREKSRMYTRSELRDPDPVLIGLDQNFSGITNPVSV